MEELFVYGEKYLKLPNILFHFLGTWKLPNILSDVMENDCCFSERKV